MKKKFNVKKRRCARLAALQSLYAWDVNNLTNQEAFLQYLDFSSQEQSEFSIDLDYYKDLFYSTIVNIKQIDTYISKYCERPFDRLDELDKALLRYSTYELLAHTEIDAPIIINESIEMAKDIGSTGSYSLVNFYLDTLNKEIRQQSSIPTLSSAILDNNFNNQTNNDNSNHTNVSVDNNNINI